MEVFRITSALFADLTGKGGLYASGRWHNSGWAVVYTADSRALAILERLVHTDPEDVPDDLVLLRIEAPPALAIQEIAEADLPSDWTDPLHPGCMSRGDDWLIHQDTPILRVPSVLARGEFNYLINPDHPAAGEIQITHNETFSFDERLLHSAQR